jgi:hypothetical protein
LRNGAKDDLNLEFVQILVTNFDDLVKPFLPDVHLSLRKGQVLTLDHRASYRSLPRLVTLDAFLEWNIKQEDHAGNAKSSC